MAGHTTDGTLENSHHTPLNTHSKNTRTRTGGEPSNTLQLLYYNGEGNTSSANSDDDTDDYTYGE